MKLKEFEIGKFYGKSEKDRKWAIKISGYGYGVFQGVCAKESKYENYLTDADIFLEPKDCTEISEAEFLRTKESVLEKINRK